MYRPSGLQSHLGTGLTLQTQLVVTPVMTRTVTKIPHCGDTKRLNISGKFGVDTYKIDSAMHL